MTQPSLISTLTKIRLPQAKQFRVTPALTLSCSLLSVSFVMMPTVASAQSIDTIEDFSAETTNTTDVDLLNLSGTHFRRPRNARSRSGSRTTTATRQGSCISDADTAFTILGPESELGQTYSTHPTFVWHLPESDVAYPVTFRLLAPDAQGIPTLMHTAELDYSAGFMKYQLPTTVPALTQNKEYRWQVVIECNPNRPSQSPSQELSFEVVPTPSDLSAALATATTEADTALAYGQNGLWYEAIAQVANASDALAQSVRMGLLQNLAELESENILLSEDIAAIAEATAR